VCHSYYEANKCEDALTSFGYEKVSNMILYEQYPIHISFLDFADYVELTPCIFYFRLRTSNYPFSFYGLL